jgi:hypothetical protein
LTRARSSPCSAGGIATTRGPRLRPRSGPSRGRRARRRRRRRFISWGEGLGTNARALVGRARADWAICLNVSDLRGGLAFSNSWQI